ncbi:PREDICTED: actin cytoskeleton-regulatory complex protein PAN1 [Tarenaya hassleriana]|uniref:actin cytoskeleton-regulatory complex protein PAN1 n=1 Tax=Tarenaya hassleriana TaxID=28532 RepID=UPI00053C904D|nr:PREDICTED: actin cytoskeleton-regulatory complex protein PAN1 [Tarenaya hassleriana]
MKTSQFMDKQIMDLSSSSPSKDFIDLMNNSQDDDHQKQRSGSIGGDNVMDSSKKEAIVPSYDFQPIRPVSTAGLSHSALDLAGSANSSVPRVFTPDSRPVSASPTRSYGSLDSLEPGKFVLEKDRSAPNTSILSEIDRTMKKHADNLLHAMEGLSARLTQLETRTRNLENLVDDLKVSVGNSHGSTDGKMRQLENILLEVQSGVQLLKDKQEIVEAQLQLSKFQISKVDQQPETQTTAHTDPVAQPPASAPQPHMPQLHPPPFLQPPAPATPSSLPQQSHPPPPSHPPQLPSQFAPQQEPYFPPLGQGQTQPPPIQPPYQVPPPAQPLQQPHQPPYQSPPQQPQYPQPSPPQQQQLQPPSSGYHPEEPPFPPQPYPPNPPRQPATGSAPAPAQQYYASPPPIYDGPGGRSSSGFPSGYSSEPYPYTGSPSPQFGSTPPMKAAPHLSSGETGGYPQLPTARMLPHALPMASAVSSGGSGSPRSGNRVPIDDVVDKVTTMGFPREQVKATVRRLTENGQAVDLNVVLDKLMNGGGGGGGATQQPPRGWFGGR